MANRPPQKEWANGGFSRHCGCVSFVTGSTPEITCELEGLLRRRLRLAAILLFVGFTVFLVWHVARFGLHLEEILGPGFFLLHIGVTAVLGVIAALLCRHCVLSIFVLRVCEWLFSDCLPCFSGGPVRSRCGIGPSRSLDVGSGAVVGADADLCLVHPQHRMACCTGAGAHGRHAYGPPVTPQSDGPPSRSVDQLGSRGASGALGRVHRHRGGVGRGHHRHVAPRGLRSQAGGPVSAPQETWLGGGWARCIWPNTNCSNGPAW